MATSVRVTRPADLRLMPFGRTGTRAVRDGIWEPLWVGRRVLVDVLGGRVSIRDADDAPIEGFDLLREAILELRRADELVLDGYLLPAPLRSSVGADAPMVLDSVMTPAKVGRQLFLGARAGSGRREELAADRARRQPLPSASPAAFVAIDLLWLDGAPLIDLPLLERKRLLESVLDDGEIVRRTVAVRPPVETWFAQWRALGFRELAVKGANSRYTPGRPNGEWATANIPKR